MKARTKFQKRVEELSQKHFSEIHPEHNFRIQKDVTESQKEWIFKNCLEHLAFATKHKAGCLDCGAKFSTSLIKSEKVICPECNTKLSVVHTKKMINYQSCYVAQALPISEFQVIRNFEVRAYYKKGRECEVHIHERLQYWADINGKTQIYGQIPSLFSNGFSGDFECRKDRGGYWSKWEIEPYKYIPGSKFRKEFSRAGVSRSKMLKKYSFLKASELFINNPIGETLYKAGEKELLQLMTEAPKEIKRLWPSIKICFRNNYKIESPRSWVDYIHMLEKYGRDIRSPKYICPENFHKEHNRYVEKERRARQAQYEIERIERLAKQMKESEEMEKEYANKKAKFLGLSFSNDTYNVHFLNSVKEFEEEGNALRHCIFSREYFKEKSLLFSVRHKDGSRYATAEVSIKTWRVLQVRVKYNTECPESKAITELITQNFKLIKDRMKPKKTIKRKKRELQAA